MKRRITVLTRETYERVIFDGRPARAWCEGCAAEVEMLTPEEAARRDLASARAVYRLAESGIVHFAETPGGLLTVCQRSLSERLASLPPQLSAGEI